MKKNAKSCRRQGEYLGIFQNPVPFAQKAPGFEKKSVGFLLNLKFPSNKLV